MGEGAECLGQNEVMVREGDSAPVMILDFTPIWCVARPKITRLFHGARSPFHGILNTQHREA